MHAHVHVHTIVNVQREKEREPTRSGGWPRDTAEAYAGYKRPTSSAPISVTKPGVTRKMRQGRRRAPPSASMAVGWEVGESPICKIPNWMQDSGSIHKYINMNMYMYIYIYI